MPTIGVGRQPGVNRNPSAISFPPALEMRAAMASDLLLAYFGRGFDPRPQPLRSRRSACDQLWLRPISDLFANLWERMSRNPNLDDAFHMGHI